MSAAGEVMRGRRRAEALMLDTCTITRPAAGKGTWNETTGQYDPLPPTTIYTGRCKVQTQDVTLTTADVAGREAFIVSWRLDLPIVGTESVQQGDTATITASSLDPALVGQRFVVQAPHLGTVKTARRLPVVAEVTKGAA